MSRNVVQEKAYTDRLIDSLRRYHNRSIETAQVIEETIEMAIRLNPLFVRSMRLQQSIGLSTVYSRDEEFSLDLANHLSALGVGSFEDFETESSVGTRRANIVATGDTGAIVVENQFGKADWDHWGRLKARPNTR